VRPFILITLDSVPWQAFLYADTPYLDSLGTPVCGRSHGDNTISSHHALFAGHFPTTKDWPGRQPKFGPNMATTFGAKGYATFGAVALPYLYPKFGFDRGFEEYKFRIDEKVQGVYYCPLEENLVFLRMCLDRVSDPAFVFLNVGETHFPYHHKGEPLPEWSEWETTGAQGNPDPDTFYRYCRNMLRAQVTQIEWVDARLAEFDWPKDAVFYVTSDHGECFGEDGFFNHTHGAHPQEIYVPVVCSDWGWLNEG